MANLNGFDANQVPPQGDMSVLPAGEYVAMITESQQKDAKTQGNQFLELTLEIMSGPGADCKGRKLWDRLNLWNHNSMAMEIAQRTLSAICHATGVLQPQDSSQLHHKAMLIKVGVRPAKGEYQESNEIKAYKPLPQQGGFTPQAAPQQQQYAPQPQQYAPQQPPVQQPAQQQYAPPQQTAPAGNVPPWKRASNG